MGITLFRDRFYHSDCHPGNIIIAPDLPPALIDWGQATSLEPEQLRTICHIVLLLATRSPSLIDFALKQSEFNFNTEELEHRVALLYYLFDSTREIDGVVSREAMDYLRDAIRYTPKRMPVLTDVPQEMVFFGRVCSVLRKSFEIIGEHNVSVVYLWRHEARNALKKLNAQDTQLTSTALLLLPDEPAGLVLALERAPDLVANALNMISRFLSTKILQIDKKQTSLAPRNTLLPTKFLMRRLTLRKLAALLFLFAASFYLLGPIIRGIAALSALLAILLLVMSIVFEVNDLSKIVVNFVGGHHHQFFSSSVSRRNNEAE
mmetsp:Transcript_13343/g.17825  ORF Transcript_13343/g.17825 Transcript_13343/m.17825 type:complete len:319 (+) Transcript_13343:1-957(+)